MATNAKIVKEEFLKKLLLWFKINKRDYPWRYNKDPYKVLIAEVLLQKTNVEKVLPAYSQFIDRYPSLEALKAAKLFEVKKIIRNLGLSYRAARLRLIAEEILKKFKGKVPTRKDQLMALNGLGRYASAAVMSFAYNKREAIVDSNIVRLLERVFGLKSSKNRPREDERVWKFAGSLLPSKKVRDYNYALLDFSALICTAKKPRHEICPLKDICKYYKKHKAEAQRPLGIDLFAGAGGLSLGFEQAGIDIVYALEKDKYAADTYKKNRAGRFVAVDTRDITKISPQEIMQLLGHKKGELDIIIGGPPCQGFSTSNMKTRSLDNPQNRLIFQFVKFVKEIQPKSFLMENVGGLDSFDDGRVKEQLIRKFNKLGYKADCLILNAVNFGVPQNRHRIFFVGNRTGNSLKSLDVIKNKKADQPVTVHDAISDLPRLKNGHDKDVSSYKKNCTLSEYQKALRRGTNGSVFNNLVSRNSSLAIKRFKCIAQGENLLELAKKFPSLVSNYKNIENCHHWIYLRLPWDKPAVTLNNYRKNMLIHPTQDRGLSVREAARLQSFPDIYYFCGSIGFQQQQVANAVPPLVAKYIANSLLRAK